MNIATILVAIPVAALIVWAVVKTIKNRGKCSTCPGGCGGGCAGCQSDCSKNKQQNSKNFR